MPVDHGRTQRDIVATDDWEVPVLEPDMLGVEHRGNLTVMWLWGKHGAFPNVSHVQVVYLHRFQCQYNR